MTCGQPEADRLLAEACSCLDCHKIVRAPTWLHKTRNITRRNDNSWKSRLIGWNGYERKVISQYVPLGRGFAEGAGVQHLCEPFVPKVPRKPLSFMEAYEHAGWVFDQTEDKRRRQREMDTGEIVRRG